MKGWAHTLGSLSMFTQLGLSLAAPLLLCVLLCSWLISRFALGTWVYIPGFFFGLGGSGATAWRVYQDIMKKQTKRKKTSGRAFNEHF
ncbi:AtpZ/AtpI family protein [Enterocloster alcoholdehydrogenati]|uniref:AtpZ/AtpI family protein n=1 Tax=Enterocloster alcoholdehydrogenati TaxID=2547410 RepID=UPI0015935101|nr:AtpZ/AtpI family protein [Enterocloster alcoholdehydrogenati]